MTWLRLEVRRRWRSLLVLAAWPARRAARLRAGQILRTE